MNEQHSNKMRWILFLVFVLMFVTAGFGTLGMIFLGWGTSQGEERKQLVNILIGQTATSVIALFYYLFGMKNGFSKKEPLNGTESEQELMALSKKLMYKSEECSKLNLENERLSEKCSQFQSEIHQLKHEIGTINNLPNRIIGELGLGKSRTFTELFERLKIDDHSELQATLGNLLREGVIEADNSIGSKEGYYRLNLQRTVLHNA